MNLTIDKLDVIEKKYLDNFEFKTELNEIEQYGLELILIHLLNEHLEDMHDCSSAFDVIDKYTIHRGDRLDILDGCYDILTIGFHSISSVRLTTNGIPVLECYEVDDEFNINEESEYYVSVG